MRIARLLFGFLLRTTWRHQGPGFLRYSSKKFLIESRPENIARMTLPPLLFYCTLYDGDKFDEISVEAYPNTTRLAIFILYLAPPVCFYLITIDDRGFIRMPIPPLMWTTIPVFIVSRDEYILKGFHVLKYFIVEVCNGPCKDQSVEGQLIEVGQLFVLCVTLKSALFSSLGMS